MVITVERKKKEHRDRDFDPAGPPGTGDDDPTLVSPLAAEPDPEAQSAQGGTPLPDAAIDRATERAQASAEVLSEIFEHVIDGMTPTRPAADKAPAPAKKKPKK